MNMNEPKLRFKADDGSQFPDWEKHKIKEFVIESNILGHTGKEAKKLTVKLWGKGVVPKKNILSGSENTQYYIRHSGQLMYGKLDFLNCAFGIVPSELDGYESTLDAPAFDIHDISDKFLLSYITRKSFYKKNGDIANGSRKAKRIHPDVFGEMSIMVPSLPEQQKIAEFLSTIDTVIEKQKETVSAWEERKKGVMQKLFSQEVRFKADDGSDFPEWEEKKLGDVADFFNGDRSARYPKETDFVKYGVAFLNTENLHNTIVDISEKCKYITYEKYCELSGAKIQLLDIIYCLRGSVGLCSLNTILEEGTVASSLMVIRAVEGIIDPIYLYNSLNSDFVLGQLYQCLNGSCAGNLSAKDMAMFKIKCPCLAEQQKIADCLSSLDEVIEKQKATLAAWEELKKGLLQQMFV